MFAKYEEIRARRAAGEKGFTLIELLVVVVIIGILVAIAIPLYLNYRNGAENKSLKSDMRNAIATEELCYTDNTDAGVPAYAAGASASAGADFALTCGAKTETVKVSAGNTLTITVPAGTPTSYVIVGKQSDTGQTYTYTSATSVWS